MLSILWPSTAMITSPPTYIGFPYISARWLPRRPALAAGLSGITSITKAPWVFSGRSIALAVSKSRSMPEMPSQAYSYFPRAISTGTTRRTRFTGMANPTPELPRTGDMIIVLTPITLPPMSSNGPPEFPGLMGASVWIIFGMENGVDPDFSVLPRALTIPWVMVHVSPKGLPMATASCPTTSLSESPRGSGRRDTLRVSTFRTARSL